MRILLVEDEPSLREQLLSRLSQRGFAVDAVADGSEGYYQASEYPYDLAIVDLGLPGLPGDQLISQVRDDGKTFPILILTARGHWQDKVAGLEAGADDYLTKPFHSEELLARVNALLRRSTGNARADLTFGPLLIDTGGMTVRVDDCPVELTDYEYRIIEYLALHSGKTVSKTELTEHIYDQDFDRDSNVIEVLIGRLRKKVDPTGVLKPITTLRGRGYRFDLQ